jgi:hypothetical protein
VVCALVVSHQPMSLCCALHRRASMRYALPRFQHRNGRTPATFEPPLPRGLATQTPRPDRVWPNANARRPRSAGGDHPSGTDTNRVAEQRHRHEPRGRCSLTGYDRNLHPLLSPIYIYSNRAAWSQALQQLLGLEGSPALQAAAHRAKSQTSPKATEAPPVHTAWRWS